MSYDDSIQKLMVKNINELLNLSDEYTKYAHIYGSYDSTSKKLELITDAFSPISIINKNTDSTIKKNINGIKLDENLNLLYQKFSLNFSGKNFNIKDLKFINNITGDTISKKHIHINYIEECDLSINDETLQLLRKNKIKYSLINDTLKILKGNYIIESNIIFQKKYKVVFSKGVKFNIKEKINIAVLGDLFIKGSQKEKVVINNFFDDKQFGCFSVLRSESSIVNINYLEFKGGSEGYWMERIHTGQFSIFNSNVIIKNSSFKNSSGDDGLNIKFSKVLIDSCSFSNNKADQLDIDFCYSVLKNSYFSPSLIDSNGDGLDFSGSYGNVYNCQFHDFIDKGLSLGENSKIIVDKCFFKNNRTAIAVKDETKLFSIKNDFVSNELNYNCFIKKKIYNCPKIFLKDKIKNSQQKNINCSIHYLSNNDIIEQFNHFFDNYDTYNINGSLSDKILLNEIINNP